MTDTKPNETSLALLKTRIDLLQELLLLTELAAEMRKKGCGDHAA
jgi:hypothetical protein